MSAALVRNMGRHVLTPQPGTGTRGSIPSGDRGRGEESVRSAPCGLWARASGSPGAGGPSRKGRCSDSPPPRRSEFPAGQQDPFPWAGAGRSCPRLHHRTRRMTLCDQSCPGPTAEPRRAGTRKEQRTERSGPETWRLVPTTTREKPCPHRSLLYGSRTSGFVSPRDGPSAAERLTQGGPARRSCLS